MKELSDHWSEVATPPSDSEALAQMLRLAARMCDQHPELRRAVVEGTYEVAVTAGHLQPSMTVSSDDTLAEKEELLLRLLLSHHVGT